MENIYSKKPKSMCVVIYASRGRASTCVQKYNDFPQSLLVFPATGQNHLCLPETALNKNTIQLMRGSYGAHSNEVYNTSNELI